MISDVKPSLCRRWVDLGVMLCVALVPGLCSLALPGRAVAATIVVNSLDDTVVSGDGACTLREAVLNAERDSHAGSTDCAAGHGADTITFSVSGTITVPSDLTIASPGGLTIDGSGLITISGGGFSPECGDCKGGGIGVAPAGVLTLKNLTVADSGGIRNGGTLAISDCTVRDNWGFFQGAIENGGTMSISASTVRGNDTLGTSEGQGVIRNGGTMTISTSTINGNGVVCACGACPCGNGGVISNGPEGTLTISNSTVSGTLDPNFPDIFSGIYNQGTMTISTSTVSDNKGGHPRGIFNSGTLKVHSSVIADDCGGPIISMGYNIDKTGTCGLTGPGDQSNLDPRLDPAGLKDNGGPTKTYALCTGSGTPAGCTGKSPAIDAIPTDNCTGAGGNPLGVDQRDFFRPADGDRNGTVLCDMGAFEATSSPLTTLNSLLTFTPLPATFQTSRDTTGCPAGYVGKFRFTADLTNKAGSPPVKHLVAEVVTLTKGNLVLNADGGLSGDGATVTFAPNEQYVDGVLTAKEHVALPVSLCLKTFDQFTFFVDVLGTR